MPNNDESVRWNRQIGSGITHVQKFIIYQGKKAYIPHQDQRSWKTMLKDLRPFPKKVARKIVVLYHSKHTRTTLRATIIQHIAWSVQFQDLKLSIDLGHARFKLVTEKVVHEQPRGLSIPKKLKSRSSRSAVRSTFLT